MRRSRPGGLARRLLGQSRIPTRGLLFDPAALEVLLVYHICMFLSVLVFSFFVWITSLTTHENSGWISITAFGIFALTFGEVFLGLASYRFRWAEYCSQKGNLCTILVCVLNLAFWVAFELTHLRLSPEDLVYNRNVILVVFLLRCVHDWARIANIVAQPSRHHAQSISINGSTTPRLQPSYGSGLPASLDTEPEPTLTLTNRTHNCGTEAYR
eukprot:TRINITY_DN14249_c0_g1_i1.p1 TRINITY_DN14249_c0_g1~~TRINITY_DN14249_c0_g1_i1.p1  ORF type:complete len:213 (+),score=27.43 TRINITY_DN14249_c0_g1_i1:51-689(+)